MSKLKVSFSDPEHGWLVLTLDAGAETVRIDASDIYPSLSGLVKALQLLRVLPGQQTVTWTCEPTEYDLVFVRDAGGITLRVLCFPDSRRSAFREDEVLSVSGSYDEVCLPFWRALKSLQGRFPQAEMGERWTSSFAWRELDALTAELGRGPQP